MLPSTLRTRWEGGRDGWRSWQGGGEDWRGGRRWQKGPVSLLAVWKDLLLHGWPQHAQEQVLQGGGENGDGDGGESGLRPWVGDGQVGETPLKREKGCKAKLKSRVSLKEHIKFVHGERRISCPAPPCTQRWRKTSTILIYQVYCQPTLKHFSGSAEARTLPTTCAPCTAPPSCSATCARGSSTGVATWESTWGLCNGHSRGELHCFKCNLLTKKETTTFDMLFPGADLKTIKPCGLCCYKTTRRIRASLPLARVSIYSVSPI